jgi:hypothetical protein
MSNTNSDRHPFGRTCGSTAATIAAVVAMLTMLGRKVGAR